MSDPKKCAHVGCSCIVAGDKKFCSQICEDSVGVTQLQCDCKHPGCSAQLV